MRKFEGTGIRDTDKGKIHYYGFNHPLCEHIFGKYMMFHQTCADGTMRKADNWWSVWSEEVSLDSLTRHVKDLECLQAGLYVYKVRDDDGEYTVVLPERKTKLKKNEKEVTKAECYCAIRFNAMAGLLKHLIG